MGNWIHCAQCKEPFMLHPETETALRRSARTFHCPWGHRQSFRPGPSEEDKLRQERDRLKQQMARVEQERDAAIRAERAAEEHAAFRARQAAAARGVVTKLKSRVANGVCPCCTRSFENLARHMATKHKGYTAEEAPPA